MLAGLTIICSPAVPDPKRGRDKRLDTFVSRDFQHGAATLRGPSDREGQKRTAQPLQSDEFLKVPGHDGVRGNTKSVSRGKLHNLDNTNLQQLCKQRPSATLGVVER